MRTKPIKWQNEGMASNFESASNSVISAAAALKDGYLVAFPTETVYGLGADAENRQAVNRLYAVKNRPANHPVIVHISSAFQVDIWASSVPEYAYQLSQHFWPGPMTLILKRTEVAKDFLTGGQKYVGLRVPSHPIALALLNEFESLGGKGVAAPSANKFGAVSPTTAISVREEIGNDLNPLDLILDGGNCLHGVESTIIDCTTANPNILRPGVITSNMIQDFINKPLIVRNEKLKVKIPGALKSHYSPKARVVLDSIAEPTDGLIALSYIPTPAGVHRLSAPRSVEEFARELYESFREADRKGISRVIVYQPQGNGLAEAIRDRLGKAASC